MNRITASLIVLVFVTHAMDAQWIDDPSIDAAVMDGIRATYNLEFATAEKAFTGVIQKRPDHPTGYFFLAMIEWWRIQLNPDDESHDAGFIKQLNRVIDMCDRILDADERNISALFFKGGAIGFRGRLYAMRKSWLKAAGDGKEALPIVQEATRYAPNNADIDLGTGIYNYYAEILPDKYPILKPLMLFLPKGNRAKGVRQLKNAADHARYANWESMFFLLQVYANYENKPSLALPYARRLREEFPNNPVFHRYLGRVYVKLGNWNDAAVTFQSVAQKCRSGALGYSANLEREASYYLGYESMLRKDYSNAMKHLVRCDELSRTLDNDGASGFMVMANLRIGQIHDLMSQRSFATKQYDKVLSMKEFNNSHDLARQFKRQPYSF